MKFLFFSAPKCGKKNSGSDFWNGILESFVMRRMLVHATTKNYNNLFTSLIYNKVLDGDTLLKKLKSGGNATTYIPDDSELRNGIEGAKLINLQAKGIIYLIESKVRPSELAEKRMLSF